MGRRPTILEFLHAPNDYPTIATRPPAPASPSRHIQAAPPRPQPWINRIPIGPGGVDGPPAHVPFSQLAGGNIQGELADYLRPEAGMAPPPRQQTAALPPKHGLEPPDANAPIPQYRTADTFAPPPGPSWGDALATVREQDARKRAEFEQQFSAAEQQPHRWGLEATPPLPRRRISKQLMTSRQVADQQQQQQQAQQQQGPPRVDPQTGWPLDPVTGQPVAPLSYDMRAAQEDRRRVEQEQEAERRTRYEATGHGFRVRRRF